jgi:hypothetical protein
MSAPTAPKTARKPRAPRSGNPAVAKAKTSKPPLADGMAATAQAAAESAALPEETVEFNGQKYRISDSVALFTLMRFARAAESGINLMDFRALAALHAFLQDCIHPDDWGRFQEDMISTKQSNLDALLDVATRVIEKLTSRPTVPPSASSSSPSGSSDGSTDGSSSTGGEA